MRCGRSRRRAEYWHIGETTQQLRSVTPRSVSGEKSSDGVAGAPSRIAPREPHGAIQKPSLAPEA